MSTQQDDEQKKDEKQAHESTYNQPSGTPGARGETIDAVIQRQKAADDEGLGAYSKQGADVQRYKGISDYYEFVYPEFRDIRYAIQQTLTNIERIEQTKSDQGIVDLCNDIRTICRRLRENCRQAGSKGDSRDWSSDRQQIIENLDGVTLLVLNKRFSAFIDEYDYNEPNQPNPHSGHLPENEAELDRWYFKELNQSERCFVLAMSAFESAPFYIVSDATRELEAHFKKIGAFPQAVKGQSGINHQPVSSLFAHTHTFCQTINGTERIFWQKPELIMRVLLFVAQQGMSIGSEHHFIQILQLWASAGHSEMNLRAARALAIIWQKHDRQQLRQLAEKWAADKNDDRWFNASVLLEGAFEAEFNATQHDEDALTNSWVLTLLKQWARPNGNADLRRTALFTYGMIGAEWPELALNGLSEALLITPAKSGVNEHSLDIDALLFGMMNYAIIAWNGEVRPVLARLASIAKSNVERPRTIMSPRELAQRSHQHEMALNLVFSAFFIIAATSLGGDTCDAATIYDVQTALPESPDIPDKHGQDVILAGILSTKEPGLRQNVITILAAALFEKHASTAFELIRRWAEIAWRNPAYMEMRTTFVDITVAIANQLRVWDSTLGAPRPAFQIIQRKLELWRGPASMSDKPINQFAQAILTTLNK